MSTTLSSTSPTLSPARRARKGEAPRRPVGLPVLCALVPLSVQLGVVMALVTALMSIVGFLLKHRGAVAAPDVRWSHPLRSTVDLFRSPIYVIGCVVATTSWGF